MLRLQLGWVTLTPVCALLDFQRHFLDIGFGCSTSNVLGKGNVTILALSYFYIKNKN